MTKHGIPDQKPGQRWAILNTTMGGTVFLEGFATLVRQTDIEDRWLVELDDGSQVERFLDAAAQEDPARYIADLNDAKG